MKIALADENAEIEPVPVEGGGHKRELEMDLLSNILKAFNEQFGTLFTDADRVARRIREDIAPKVAADQAYQNARKNTPNSARIEHDKALAKVITHLRGPGPLICAPGQCFARGGATGTWAAARPSRMARSMGNSAPS